MIMQDLNRVCLVRKLYEEFLQQMAKIMLISRDVRALRDKKKGAIYCQETDLVV